MEYLLSFNINYTIIVQTLIVFSFLYYFLGKFRISKSKKSPPEAAGKWPLIGHLWLLSGSELPHITLSALSEKHGPIYTIQSGIYKRLVVNKWEIAKEIFTVHDLAVTSRPRSCAAKYLGYNYADFGFAPYGSYWREMRKIVASKLLSNTRLESLKHVRAVEVESSVKELYKMWTDGDGSSQSLSVEMRKWFGDLNLNVILRMVAGKKYFSTSVSGDEEEASRCRDATRELFHLAGVFVVRDAIPFLGFLDISGYEKAMKKTAKELDSLAEQWIEEHRRRQTESGYKANEDFMDVLLSNLGHIDLHGFDVNTVCKATCLALVSGGTDTITITLIWALALLLNHPDELQKVQEELDAHIGKNRLVKESDIDKLVYLQAVVKETLRLYPAAPLSGSRYFKEDCTVSGYHVPAGTRLIVNVWKIHRDPRIWSDPLDFKPERFVTTHKDFDLKGQNFELLPFGGGRRRCPGLSFGLQMTHLTLAILLHSFDMSRSGNAEVDMTGSAGSTNFKATPLDVLIKPRLNPCVYEE